MTILCLCREDDLTSMSFRACGLRNFMKALQYKKWAIRMANPFVTGSAVIATMRLSTLLAEYARAIRARPQAAVRGVGNSAQLFSRSIVGTLSEESGLHSLPGVQPFVHDSDAVYVVWSFGIILQMKNWDCKLIYFETDDQLLGDNPLVRLAKRVLMLLPTYRYAGSTSLMVFER